MVDKKILVLGVGNVLLGDEGVGVHAVRALSDGWIFPENVVLLDGGTLGLALMDYLLDLDLLLVLDAVRGGGGPGTLYRLEDEGLRRSRGFSDSLHQLDLLDTLNLYELAEGKRPRTVVFGMEPENIEDLSVELTPAAAASLPGLCEAVVDALRVECCNIVKLHA